MGCTLSGTKNRSFNIAYELGSYGRYGLCDYLPAQSTLVRIPRTFCTFKVHSRFRSNELTWLYDSEALVFSSGVSVDDDDDDRRSRECYKQYAPTKLRRYEAVSIPS
ncbi:hypothetical protein CLF_111101 [Clonorchis sinensis]|uniref:Uncharacterized protein n=1 Tax=Clonorchis sinensis TaxID=79923 RepID=G7YUD1_CLOSI|nr:hypothetical protein CLF_111101 [Clonorchis sinensis]